MITNLFKHFKYFLTIPLVLLIFILTSCFEDRIVVVEEIYDVTTTKFNVSSDALNTASKACVEGINETTDKKYSGVIFLKKESTYYVALPYYDTLTYESIILYDQTKITPQYLACDVSNKLCVYTFETTVDVEVIKGNNDTIYKTQMIASLSTPSDKINIASYKNGIVSSVNSSYFTTDILLSEPDIGGIIINENAEMIGFLYSYSYLSEGDTIGETYNNYVKGINQAYRYEDFYKYVINLVENGSFTKGLMGITQTNNEYAALMAKQYNLEYIEPEIAKGLSYIIAVKGSAQDAGVEAGQFIYEVNGIKVYRTTDVSHIMSFMPKGTNITLKTIDSNSNIKTYTITLS